MLLALKGDAHGFSRIRGILIVADAADDPQRTFRAICDQIRDSGYPVPGSLGTLAAGSPSIQVMLLPDDATPGSLETLLVSEILARNAWISSCLDAYMTCGSISVKSWSQEKQDKAKYGCLVGALHSEDPSRAASFAFRSPPVVDIGSRVFDDVEQRILQFCRLVGHA